MQGVSALEGGYDHLAEDGFLLLKVSQLLLKVIILFLLVDHAQLQTTIERFH